MAETVRPPERIRRLYRRVAGYFGAVFDPALSGRDRIVSGAKGLAVLGALGFALLFAYAIILIPFTPSIANIRKAKIDQPTVLISSDGKRLATLKPMNREWVRLNRISPQVINALIATEDHRFYEHHGIDVLRSAAGLLRILIGDPEGGSTSDPATRAQSLSRRNRPKAHAHAKIQGDDHGDQNRIRLQQKRNPGNLPQHDSVFIQRLRHRNGGAHLLR